MWGHLNQWWCGGCVSIYKQLANRSVCFWGEEQCNWQFSTYPIGEYWPSYGVEKGLRARFLCGHYTLLAHATLAKWYHDEFKGRGRISFKNSGSKLATPPTLH